jgi:hypothetical protein
MKSNVNFGLSLFLMGVILFSGNLILNAQKVQGPSLEFVKEKEDLGVIKVSELDTYNKEIEFVNKGDQALIISQVRGCCGTRIVDWPKEPINPGEKGIIKIQFRLNPRAHAVSRVVTVMSNEPGGQKVFRIVGEVVEDTVDVNVQ